jgi:6-phosphogluconolactonase
MFADSAKAVPATEQEAQMSDHLYVALRGDDRILRYRIDGGSLAERLDFVARGGPGPLALHPSGGVIFAGLRDRCALAAYRVNSGGRIESIWEALLPSEPCFLSTAVGGRFVLSAYYGAGQIAVHEWSEHRKALEERQRVALSPRTHSVIALPGERYIAALHTGSGRFYRFALNTRTGSLTAEEPLWIDADNGAQVRHSCLHPTLPRLYAVNEGDCSVSVYGVNAKAGMLNALQTLSALPLASAHPPSYMAAEVRLSPDSRRLYVSIRGYDHIACFSVSPLDGKLSFLGAASSPASPRSFDISPDGRYLYAAGESDGMLAVYELSDSAPKETSRLPLGRTPMWVMATSSGGRGAE